VGFIERAYDGISGTLEMRNVFLDKLPSKIKPKNGAMLTPEGTPTQTYLTLHQMKKLGVGYGKLTKIKMSTIQNIRSVIELEVLSSKLPLDEAVLKTHSVTYAETTVIQSGHKIVGGKVTGQGRKRPLQELLDHYETHGNPHGPRDAAIVSTHDELLAKFGDGKIDRQTPVLWDYNIELSIEPFGSGSHP